MNHWHTSIQLLLVILLFPLMFIMGEAGNSHGASDISVSAELRSNSFDIDSNTTLLVTVSGSKNGQIQLPEVEHLTIQGRGKSTQIQFINGKMSASLTSTYIIYAAKPGKYTIPPITIAIDKEEYATDPLHITVTSGQQNQPVDQKRDSATNSNPAFLQVHGVPQRIYPGEVIPITIKSYFKKGLRVEIPDLPELQDDNLILTLLKNEPQQSTEIHNGQSYSVVTFDGALSAIKEGDFTLEVNLDTTLLIPQKRRRNPINSNSPFNDDFFSDDIFNSFFGGYRKQNLALKTSPHKISVPPLPQSGMPESFDGAIGKYDFKVTANPLQVEIGEPITLLIAIRGEGNFDRVNAPLFTDHIDFKTYTPSAQFTEGKHQYTGEKVFEQAIVPQNGSVTTIPPLIFSYFNPEKDEYVELASEPIKLDIIQGNNEVSQLPDKQMETTLPSNIKMAPEITDSSFLRLEPGDFASEIKPVFKEKAFLIIAAICTFILFIISALTIRKNIHSRNREQRIKAGINKNIQSKLNILKKEMDQQISPEVFLQKSREIIQIKLGTLWDLEPSVITLLDIKNRAPSNVFLIELFSYAEQSAYGSVEFSSDKIDKYYNLLQKEIKELS